jgi:hypothetical protein
MNLNNYKNFLLEYNVPTGGLVGFYSFSGYSGEIIYNDIYESSLSEDGCITSLKYPLFLGCSGDGVYIDSGSLYMNGQSVLRLSETFSSNDWTIFLNFSHSKHSTGLSNVLISNLSEDGLTGLVVGITDSNRIYIEYQNGSSSINRYFQMLDDELNNQNIISVGKNGNNLDIINHDPLANENLLISTQLRNYSNNNIWSIGNTLYDLDGYTGISGKFDHITVHNTYLNYSQRNGVYESLVSSGIERTSISLETQTFNKITGSIYNNVITGTGVTGYSTTGLNDLEVKCSTLEICGIIGLTGELSGLNLSLLRSSDEVTIYNRTLTVRSVLYDYDYLNNFGNSSVYFNLPYSLDENDNFEIFNYSENFKSLNLIPTYFSPNSTLVMNLSQVGEDFNLYLNGILQISGSGLNGEVLDNDYIVSSYSVDSDLFYEKNVDKYDYDKYSGEKLFSGIAQETGVVTISDSNYFDKDIFFNGQKILSGVGYDYSGGNLNIDLSDHGTGKLYFLSRGTSNFNFYTGSSVNLFEFDVPVNSPMIWLNGIRLSENYDYILINNNSLLKNWVFESGEFVDTIYSGETIFLNI